MPATTSTHINPDDNCAINPETGELLDASEIPWLNSPTDENSNFDFSLATGSEIVNRSLPPVKAANSHHNTRQLRPRTQAATATTSSATSQKRPLWDSSDSEDDRKNMPNKKKSKKSITRSDDDIADHGSSDDYEDHQADDDSGENHQADDNIESREDYLARKRSKDETSRVSFSKAFPLLYSEYSIALIFPIFSPSFPHILIKIYADLYCRAKSVNLIDVLMTFVVYLSL